MGIGGQVEWYGDDVLKSVGLIVEKCAVLVGVTNNNVNTCGTEVKRSWREGKKTSGVQLRDNKNLMHARLILVIYKFIYK